MEGGGKLVIEVHCDWMPVVHSLIPGSNHICEDNIREGSWLRTVTASPREKLVSDGSHDHLTNSLLSSSLYCNVYSVLQASTLRFNRPYRLYRVKIRPRSVAGARIHYKTSMRCRLGWPHDWLREAQVGDERLRSEPKSQRLREHRTEPLGAKRSL